MQPRRFFQDLRRRLYVKAKAEPSWRFWGLYGHVCKRETLRAAYEMAKQNNGAPGTDGVAFEAIEVDGVESFLDQLREELVQRCYRPQRPRKVGIPKSSVPAGARSAANPHAACEAAGTGDGITVTPIRARKGKPSTRPRSRLRITAPVPDPTAIK